MSVAKDLIFEELESRCAECGEEFPEYAKNKWIAQGMREAAKLASKNGLWDDNIREIVCDIDARAQELDPK